MRIAPAALALFSLITVAPFAAADDPPRVAAVDAQTLAKQRYAAGQKAYADGRYAEAALYLEAAASEIANALAVYGAALAWEKANVPDRAADAYAHAAATPGLPAGNLQDAKDKLAALEGVLGRIDVTAPVDAWFVQIDGNTEQACPAQLHATPGMHTLRVRGPGRPMERRAISVGIGQVTKIELASPPPEDSGHAKRDDDVRPAPVIVAAPSHEAPRGVQIRRATGLVAIGVGVATVAAGAVIGLQALDGRDAYNAHPSQGGFDHATALQNWTNIAFVAGGIFVVGGAVLVFWPYSQPSDSAKPPPQTGRVYLAPTLGGAVLRGSF